jgi:hypothetical protein
MTAAATSSSTATASRISRWSYRVDLSDIDTSPELTERERQALAAVDWQLRRRADANEMVWQALGRLRRPLVDLATAKGWFPAGPSRHPTAVDAIAVLLRVCHERQSSYWAFEPATWGGLIGQGATEFARDQGMDAGARSILIAMAWTLSGFDDFHLIGKFSRRYVAHKVFGVEPVERALSSVQQVMHGWGYQDSVPANSWFRTFLIQALLINRSPLLDDLTTEAVEQLRLHPSFAGKPLSALFGLQRALAALGITEPPKRRGVQSCSDITDASLAWTAAVEKWFATSTLTRNVRRGYRTILARAGRWLAANHPDITEPGQWTRQTCAAWVAAVDRMNRGAYVQDPTKVGSDPDKPLSPLTKIAYLRPLRVFFNDLQEWEWIRRQGPGKVVKVSGLR